MSIRKFQLDDVHSDGPIIQLPEGVETHSTGLSYSVLYDGYEYRSSHPMVIGTTYGACGVAGCKECRPLFDSANREISES